MEGESLRNASDHDSYVQLKFIRGISREREKEKMGESKLEHSRC
jgi:hypothetical protein